MGNKQLKLLLGVFAILVLAVAVLKLVRHSTIDAPMTGVGEKVIPEFPINEIAEIAVKAPDGSLTLKRKEGEGNLWMVAERAGYRADFGKISGLLREIWKLEVAQVLEAGPSQFGRFGLLEPGAEGEGEKQRGTLLEFKSGAGEAVASLLVGKEYKQESKSPSPMGGFSSTPAGRYVKAADSEDIWLVSETLSSVAVAPADWINKDFFKVEKLKTIERKSRSKHDDWKLARKTEDGEWTLLFTKEGEELDDTKIGSLKSAFSSPRFDDVAVGVEALGDEATEFVLTTFDGFTYKVRVGKELDDRKHHLSLTVEAKFPAKRKAGEDESEEDKIKKDDEFAEAQKKLKEKLAAEQALAGRVFVVPNYVASPLIKKRVEITKTAPEAGEPGAEGKAKKGAAPAGGAKADAKAAAQPAGKATAVTEPIKVDLPAGGKKDGAGKKDGQ